MPAAKISKDEESSEVTKEIEKKGKAYFLYLGADISLNPFCGTWVVVLQHGPKTTI